MKNFVNYDDVYAYLKKVRVSQGVLLEELSSLVGEQLPPAGLPPVYLSVIVVSSFMAASSMSIFSSNLYISWAVV